MYYKLLFLWNWVFFSKNSRRTISYLKEALALIKAKIGADTKEPLTRSFNEQAKGFGNDGKGDRSNYYDFLKGVQE